MRYFNVICCYYYLDTVHCTVLVSKESTNIPSTDQCYLQSLVLTKFYHGCRPKSDALISLDCAQALVDNAIKNVALLRNLIVENTLSVVSGQTTAGENSVIKRLTEIIDTCTACALFLLEAHTLVGWNSRLSKQKNKSYPSLCENEIASRCERDYAIQCITLCIKLVLIFMG